MRKNLPTILLCIGAVFIAAGVAMLSVPAGLIAAGVQLAAGSFIVICGGDDDGAA